METIGAYSYFLKTLSSMSLFDLMSIGSFTLLVFIPLVYLVLFALLTWYLYKRSKK